MSCPAHYLISNGLEILGCPISIIVSATYITSSVISIVTNANLCLESNSFISYLVEKQLNESILLQSRGDYLGLNDCWLLHLPKHISQLH